MPLLLSSACELFRRPKPRASGSALISLPEPARRNALRGLRWRCKFQPHPPGKHRRRRDLRDRRARTKRALKLILWGRPRGVGFEAMAFGMMAPMSEGNARAFKREVEAGRIVGPAALAA